MNILVVDDAVLIAHTTKEMLADLGYKKVKTLHDADTARQWLQRNSVDLAVLDINLGKGEEGLELAALCVERNVPFFYVSSYTDKATLDKALAKAPGAYVVKPFLNYHLYSALQITLSKKPIENRILRVKDGKDTISLKTVRIKYLRAENVYVEIVTLDGKHLYRGSLGSLMDQLPTDKFFQTHRSYAVNIDFLQKMNASCVEVGDLEIPLSRTYRNGLKALLEI